MAEALGRARQALSAVTGGAPFGTGADTDFAILNRNPPPAPLVDLLAFAINPQVHATDEASMVETLEGQEAAVRTALALAAGKPVVVSPVTLKARFNPYATAPALATPPGELPAWADARQTSLFCAAWTASCLRSLATAGAESVTFYETTGPAGVLDASDEKKPTGDSVHLPVPAGAVYPVYHLLRDLAGQGRAEVVATRSSDRLAVQALAVLAGDRLRILIANLGPASREVAIAGLADASGALTILDETVAQSATLDPEAFRAAPARSASSAGGVAKLALAPFALARLDVA